MDARSHIICLMGPTASGKTDLAVKLTQRLPCEIISVDSAMIYRGMDIGTAKPSPEILAITHHRLLDIRDPIEPYSAGQFREDALREIADIIKQERIPLLVGGTMLYFHVLQHGLAKLPRANQEVRKQILFDAQTYGWQFLHERLQRIDPVAAQRIHPHDPQRIQRALEIYELTGKSITTLCEEKTNEIFPYPIINIAIAPNDRNLLHANIAARFHNMLRNGLVAEVEKLYQRRDLNPELPSMRAVGYRQIWDYLAGKISYAEMQERSIIATRQYAKRQLTWLRSWKELHWIASEDPKCLDKTLDFLNAEKIF